MLTEDIFDIKFSVSISLKNDKNVFQAVIEGINEI